MAPPVWYLIVSTCTGTITLGAVRIGSLWIKVRFAEWLIQQAREQGVEIEPLETLRIVVGRATPPDTGGDSPSPLLVNEGVSATRRRAGRNRARCSTRP